MMWKTCIAILLAALFSGCADGNDGTTLLASTSASYRVEGGGDLLLRLDVADNVLLQDGRRVQAYRVIAATEQGDLYHLFLDKDLRLLRTDVPCAIRTPACTHGLIQWSVAGALPAFGIGLGGQHGSIGYALGPGPYEATITRDSESHRVDTRQWPADLHGILGPGTYAFEDSDLFPSSMSFKWADQEFKATRTALEEGPVLPNLETSHLAPPLVAGNRFTEAVPSGGDHILGQPESLQEMLDILAASNADAASRLEAGECVTRMRVFPYVPPEGGMLSSRSAIAEIQLGGRTPAAWQLTRESNLLGNRYEATNGQPRMDVGTCATIRHGPAQIEAAASFAARSLALNLAVDRPLQFIITQTEHPAYLENAQAGSIRYQMHWVPEGSSNDSAFQAVSITYQPAQGWLERALLAPEDASNFGWS